MAKRKIRVGVVFGGRSAEHEVSLLSAKNVIEALDKRKYEPVLIGIDKNGEWHLREAGKYLLNAHDPKKVALSRAKNQVALVAQSKSQTLVNLEGDGSNQPIDVIFPIMHGTYGEDGSVQGLLKMAGVPFVGASVLGSAIGMDKDVMKRLLRDAGLGVAKFLCLTPKTKLSFQQVVKQLGLPVFVKPANLGSSVGVTKVKKREEFAPALAKAFLYDHKVLVEEFIEGREIECSVIGNDEPIASLPGEVVPKDEFNTYETKYMEDSGAVFHYPAPLDAKTTKRVQETAILTYKTLCCEGFARVDLFLKKNGDVIVNEINTLPGCTNTSVFPKLWEVSGLSFPQVVDKLIEFALERAAKEKQLKTTFG